jgi:hypothetical protein
VSLVLGIAFFFSFLAFAELHTQPWYFLPLMTFATATMDAALADWIRRLAPWTLVFFGVTACLLFVSSSKNLHCRRTNLDLVATELQQRAVSGDLIVVFPCHCGITFGRYYKGSASWTTLPALEDHRFHRFDLVKEKMQSTEPIKPVLDRAEKALTSGHKVWIVADLPDPGPLGLEPPRLPPAPLPDRPRGWYELPYLAFWGRELSHFLVSHAEELASVPIPAPTCISEYEDVPLMVASGWRKQPAPNVGGE